MSGAALITGGAKRIGAAITRAIAGGGTPVVIHYRSAADEAEALARAITDAGGAAYTIGADLADNAAVGSLIARAEALAGPIDVLVNNASHFIFDQAATVTSDSIAAHIAPNLTAPVILA
ncbi:SDR family NAD(P)-dependent oxidoreductase [Acidiphilium sp. 34-64-41]|nr:SDR family NAD(P)-dependent oxidoreductase [Acidiphilium sp. 34-64-41]